MQAPADFQIFDALAEGVVVISAQGNVLYTNAAARVFSRDATMLQDLYPLAHAAMLQEQTMRCSHSGEKGSLLSALKASDGQNHVLKFTIQPFGDNVLLLCTNVTDCHRQLTDGTTAIAQYHKAVLDNTTSGIVLIGHDHKVLCFNREIQKDLRLYFDADIRLGDDYRDFVIEDLKELYLWAFSEAMNGETVEVETETVNGTIAIWYQYKVNPVYDDDGCVLGVSLSATNIDERKRREIALKEKEEEIRIQNEKIISDERYYRTLIETSSDAIVLLDANGAVKYITPSATTITGYTLSEMQALDTVSLIHPEDIEADGADYSRLAATQGSTMRKRHRMLTKNGTYKWISASYRNLLNDPDVQAMVITYSDISDKVYFEKALTKSNRELAVLNQINDIILRSRCEPDLYRDVCACITESGGYALAWIGMKPDVNDPDQSVPPVASAGNVSYLEDIRIVMDDPYLSDGPTGRALRYGATIVTNNVSNSTNYRPWLEKARKHGIASSLVLPLKIQDSVHGALNIYSAQTDAFDANEVSVLERLATNLALAVHHLRTEEEKARAKHLLNERIKELTVIHHIHKLLQQSTDDIEDVLKKIAVCIPDAWQFPGVCVARIDFGTESYFSKNYTEPVVSQQSRFYASDGREGVIEVGYTQHMPNGDEGPFMIEERNLLNSITETVEVYILKAIQQHALVLSEEYFRTSFEYAAIGKALTSINGNFIKVNRAFCNMLGYTQEELLTMKFVDVTHPDDIGNAMIQIKHMLAGTQNYYRAEKRYLRKDGITIWGNLNTSLVRDRQGRPLYFVSQVENIDDRKKAQAELIRSEAQMRSIFDHTEAGYLLLDRQLTVRAFNQRFSNGLAIKAHLKLNINENFLHSVPAIHLGLVQTYLEQVITTSQPVEYEAALGKGPEKCYFQLVAVPVTNNDYVIGVCISATEITVRKKMEIERQELIEELLLKNRDLEQFAQILSHNVRGPLATILGLNGFISENMSQEDFLFMIQGIRTSSERLDTVIRDLNEILSLRRELTEAKELVDLHQMTADVWRSIDQMVQESGAQLHTDFRKVHQLVTVKSYMRHILYQLLSNSIRFRKSGTVPEIKIWTERADDKVVIYVADNGMGIDMTRFGSKLFQLYQRFHLSVPGKGLGLYLTKTMVEILHGKIVADSKPGEGMTFRITLPA